MTVPVSSVMRRLSGSQTPSALAGANSDSSAPERTMIALTSAIRLPAIGNCRD